MHRLQRLRWLLHSSTGKLLLVIAASLLVFVIANKAMTSPPVPKATQNTTASNPEQNSQKNPAQSPPPNSSPHSSPSVPGSTLDLRNWRLTLPIDTKRNGSPDEISQPELATFSLTPYFDVNPTRDGVVFQANVGGDTTSGSRYPRTELREMTQNGSQEASWSDTKGSHTMIIKEAITHLPTVKPQVVAGQIHDAKNDVVMVRLEDKNLFIEANGNSIGTLDDSYVLGTIFTVQITAANGYITVDYNGVPKVNYPKKGSGWYFKAGCYTQSNPSKGDNPNDYGEVAIYALSVNHS